MQREEIVERYFQAWLDQNIEPLGSIFPMTLYTASATGPNIVAYPKS